MSSYIYPLLALFVIVRFSSQGVIEDNNFSRPRRNFFMSSGPSRARVMEMERLVNSIFPRKTRDTTEPIPVEVPPLEAVRPLAIAESIPETNQPCFCPVFSPCIGKCYRTYRYW
ncbi:hypothetical protein OESDEN_13700 [Oesophagostomum dentatum]|uniref:Uncharacterized protein n=1 Tax=Oesophagostomum dentatum TaxID=61180 RepID=A0A0B1SMI8_OESDE|nr:hypothetical protein OESDEN_13700 [Oesophagostomum dentatum]